MPRLEVERRDPPLQAGESPPLDKPNYFEPTELSSGAVLLELDHCVRTSARAALPRAADAGADMGATVARIRSLCECIADAFYDNFHRNGHGRTFTAPDHLATKEQVVACAAYVTGSGDDSLVRHLVHGRAHRLDELFEACSRTDAGDPDFLVSYCSCHVDMTMSGRDQAGNRTRCSIAAKHRLATQRHLTVRQFHDLRVD